MNRTLHSLVTKTRWQFAWDRRVSYQKMNLFAYAYLHEMPKMFGVRFSKFVCLFSDGVGSQCYDSSEYARGFKKIGATFCSPQSGALIRKLTKRIESAYTRFAAYVASMPTSYERMSDTELAKRYTAFCSEEQRMSLPVWLLYVPFEEAVTQALRGAVEKRFGRAEASTALEVLSVPTKQTPLEEYRAGLYAIAVAPISKMARLRKSFLKKHRHFGMFDVTYEPYSEAKLDAALTQVSTETARAVAASRRRTVRAEVAAARATYGGSVYERALIDFFQCYVNYKEWKNLFREQGSFKLRILLQTVAHRHELTLEEVAYMLPSEIVSLLKKGNRPDPAELQQRRMGSLYVWSKREIGITTEPELMATVRSQISSAQTKTLSGTTGFPGSVRGTARVVLSPADCPSVLEGDILVTPTTRPDYLPAMHRAAAIVTNEGGLLSHAAIISRELRKPCVIGTKLATKVFKNGDTLLVEASAGTVTKI